MPQLGESIDVPMPWISQDHSESTCPWHEKASPSAEEMPAESPNDDSKGTMAANSGGTLGDNLNALGEDKDPSVDNAFSLYYVESKECWYYITKNQKKKRKVVQRYRLSATPVPYRLKYGAHHLIPGNASLKGSGVVPLLGDDSVIKNFVGKGQSSFIKPKMTVGYDVNSAPNGVWLPAPYALSGKNDWPSVTGMKIVSRRQGVHMAMSKGFRTSYVKAAIEHKMRQFHMSHEPYSNKVREILDAIALKTSLLAGGGCPLMSDPKTKAEKMQSDGKGGVKVDPPYGLLGRLNALSGKLKTLLMDGVWRDPFFTDSLTKKYATTLDPADSEVDLDVIM